MPSSADLRPLRCHLLIGPPASGKTTLASVLAELTGALVLTAETDPERLHQQVGDAVSAGTSVIIDGDHCHRHERLMVTQGFMQVPPVQWIGWWLTTPLDQCLTWNNRREHPVEPARITTAHRNLPTATYTPPTSVIKRLNSALQNDPDADTKKAEKLAELAQTSVNRGRSALREEGFTYVVAIDPSTGTDLHRRCGESLSGMDAAIVNANNRKQGIQLHRYSLLLDLERLIYLIRLLLEFPGLEFGDGQSTSSLALSDIDRLRRTFRFNPDASLPPAEALFCERAAFALRHRHGPCYGDEDAIADDLGWLLDQGFVSALPVLTPVKPGEATPQVLQARHSGAGFPAAADLAVFQRQFGLLRHLIQNPFDHPRAEDSDDEALHLPRRSAAEQPRRASGEQPVSKLRMRRRSASLRMHLLSRLQEVEGVSYGRLKRGKLVEPLDTSSPQVRTLDKDIELLIGGYGFRDILFHHHGSN